MVPTQQPAAPNPQQRAVQDLKLGIALGVFYAFLFSSDNPSGPLPHSGATFGTVLITGALGLLGLLLLVRRSTRRSGQGLLVIGAVALAVLLVAGTLSGWWPDHCY